MMIDVSQMEIHYSFVPLAFLGGMVGRFLIGGLISGVIMTIVRILSRPVMIAGLIFLLMYYPDTVAWVFMKIGEIQLHVFAIILSAVLPDIFPTSDIDSWAGVWNGAISAFPQEVIDTMSALDLAGLLGMITSCLTAGFTIKLYMRLVKRIGVI